LELITKIEYYFDIIGIEDKIFIVPGSGVRTVLFRVHLFRGHGVEELQDAIDLVK